MSKDVGLITSRLRRFFDINKIPYSASLTAAITGTMEKSFSEVVEIYPTVYHDNDTHDEHIKFKIIDEGGFTIHRWVTLYNSRAIWTLRSTVPIIDSFKISYHMKKII